LLLIDGCLPFAPCSLPFTFLLFPYHVPPSSFVPVETHYNIYPFTLTGKEGFLQLNPQKRTIKISPVFSFETPAFPDF
jgi:hypothetical protein